MERTPDLTGRRILVTGGTRGIGRAVAEAVVAHGASVAIGARAEDDVRAFAAELAATADPKARVSGIRCDVRDARQCADLVDAAAEALGGLDVLVNNAGIGRFEPGAEMEPVTWVAVIETNLSAVFYCTHAALPHLRAAGDAWVINMASLAGKNAFPRAGAYNASKFGLVGFSEALMQEVRHDGIRVSYIMPGSVATDFSHPEPGTDDAWKIQPEDLARIVLDLLATAGRTLPSRIEVRPSRPPKR
jgi:NAD(P)-dependent dehydrogenase (short-subunit alcohol dehydrogenase family)